MLMDVVDFEYIITETETKSIYYCDPETKKMLLNGTHQFEGTDISLWLEEHAHEYGFTLRYPKNKASITGYTYDSHVYRYVGKDLAKTLYNSSLCLEEYNLLQE